MKESCIRYFSLSLKNILTRKVKLWIFFTHSTRKKTPQNNFSSQKFSVENNYSSPPALKKLVYQKCYALTTICFHENGFDQLRSTTHRFFGILVMS